MTMKSVRFSLAAGTAVLAIALASAAFAAGTAPSPTTTTKCTDFKKGTAEWTKCMKSGHAAMNNEELYATGYTLAKAGDYQDALEFLNAGTDKKDPRFLTMIGYSTRKLGKVDEGMGYYMQALAIDPNSVTTREYLGEAYLQKKDLPDAKAQLVQIQDRCGTTCESFTELNEQISKFQTGL
jgi:tetratricopeptide (TPR) repeat protein